MSIRRVARWGLPILAIVTGEVFAQQPAGDSVLVLGEEWKLPAGALPEERTVWVHLPPGYHAASERYDVLYVLDAHALFPLAASSADYLSILGRMSPLIVVGVTSLSPGDRARNFTPVIDESRRDRFPNAGGADRFLRFVERELIPAVDARYRTSSRRLLAGHSLAGLFVLHALAARPLLFQDYVAISPSLGWANGYTFEQLEAHVARAAAPRFLFVSIGHEPGRLTEWIDRLETVLQAAPRGWRSRIARFPGEDHVTTVAPALHAALRAARDTVTP
jgi:uncharacterized protein